MQLRDGRVSGICLCDFHGYAPIRGFVVFTPYAGWQGIGFMVYALLSLVPGSRRIMEVFRVLKIGFVSSISFLGVRLVLGVFGCLTEIYIS